MKKAVNKYKIVLAVFFLFFALSLAAQGNLVQNPSFEDYNTTCMYGFNTTAYSWYPPPPVLCTPDLFNACAPFPYSIPTNDVGVQSSHSGKAYAAIFMYRSREYIECKLIQPLQAGKKYCAGFYVSLADTCNYGISTIGMFFSNDTVHSNGFFAPLLYAPQIENDTNNIITDKTNWVKISGKYIAKGGEQFITIGNFFDSATTARHVLKVSNYPEDIALGHTTSYYSYYYIDDVFVYACGSTLQEKDTFSLFVPNVFTPNADGVNDLFTVKATAVSYANLQIYNRWGSLLYKQAWQAQDSTKTSTSLSWAGRTSAGIACSAGTYYYVLTYTKSKGNSTAYKKGSFTLLR